MNMPRILVSGLAGIPGWCAFAHFQAKWPGQVWGLLPKHYPIPNKPQIIPWNAEETATLSAIYEQINPTVIIDTSGNCALKNCEYDQNMARLLNVQVGEQLLALAQTNGAYIIRLSSDLVFAGREGGDYREEEATDPVTVYGKCMAIAEDLFLASSVPHAIFRISLPMGPSLNGHAGAVDWIESRFKRNLPATLYYDEIRRPFYVQDYLKILEYFIEQQHTGLYHLGGTLKWSLNQIAQIVNRTGSYSPNLLHGCMRLDAGPIPPRAGDVTMNIDKLQSILPSRTLGPWPIHTDLHPTDRDWHTHRITPWPHRCDTDLWATPDESGRGFLKYTCV